MAALATLATLTTETPWRLSRAIHDHARQAGLDDDAILHAIALSSYFGHLNRVADAVAVPLDYTVRQMPPAPEPATPALERAPESFTVGELAIPLAKRPATATALAAWTSYVFDKPAPLDPRARRMIRHRVASLIGDSAPPEASASALDTAILALTEQVTLAPWQLGPASYAALRAHGFDDAALFDVVTTASTAGVGARIAVALSALRA